MKVLTIWTAICPKVYCSYGSRHGQSSDTSGCTIPGLPWRLEQGGRTEYNCEEYSCECGGRFGGCSWFASELSPCQFDTRSNGVQFENDIKLPNPIPDQQDLYGNSAFTVTSPLPSLPLESNHGKGANPFSCSIPGLHWPLENGGRTVYNCKEYSCECDARFGGCQWFASQLSPCQSTNSGYPISQTTLERPHNSPFKNTETIAYHNPVNWHVPITHTSNASQQSPIGNNIFGRYMNQMWNQNLFGRKKK